MPRTRKERWQPILEGHYAVSDQGRLRRIKPDRFGRQSKKLMHPSIVGRGYLSIMPSLAGHQQRRYYVHRLVTEAFLGPCPPKQEVNHKNGRKRDNRLTNLEYVSRTANCRHARDLGIKIGCTKLTPKDVAAIRRLRQSGQAVRHLSSRFGVNKSTIWCLLRRATWN